MQEGAFALIDCLGWKGIWKRRGVSASSVIGKMSKIEEIVQKGLESEDSIFNLPKLISKFYSQVLPIEPRIKLLSDTVAISLQYENNGKKKLTETERQFLVFLMFPIVGRIVELFIEEKPHLVMRGCITFGKHICDRNFIIGPAVDEAAEGEKIADGAFIWLHPNVTSILQGIRKDFETTAKKFAKQRQNFDEQSFQLGLAFFSMLQQMPLTIDNYLMPLKDGRHLECSVFNPLMFARERQETQRIIDIYKKVISENRLDIWLKYQNTMQFLEVASEVSIGFYERFYPQKEELSKIYPQPLIEKIKNMNR